MKKYLFGTILAAAILFSLTAGTAFAAGEPELSPPPGLSKAGPCDEFKEGSNGTKSKK